MQLGVGAIILLPPVISVKDHQTEQNLRFFLIVNMILSMLRVMIVGLSCLFIIGVKIQMEHGQLM